MSPAEYNLSVDLFSDGLFRFALKQVRDRDTANDMVQEAYTRLWEKHSAVEYQKVKSYLFTTVYHLVIDRSKQLQRTQAIEKSHHLYQVKDKPYLGLQQILHKALDTLPEIQKTLILLRDYEGYSYEEMGKITGLTESQVKVYIYRGRVALKEYIGKLEHVL